MQLLAPPRPALRGPFALALLALSALAVPAGVHAQVVNRNGTQLAIGGYDPVAYHTEGRAVLGAEAHSHRWQGATWRFASEANRARFVESPSRYAPAYGGYCAYAMARGQAVRIDPEAFSIVGGKLYLNYDLATRRRWKADQSRFIREANARWPEVRARLRGG